MRSAGLLRNAGPAPEAANYLAAAAGSERSVPQVMRSRSLRLEDPEPWRLHPQLGSTLRSTEESRLLVEECRCLDSQMGVGALGCDSATGSSLEKTELDEIRLVDIHDRIGFFTDCRCQRLDTDRSATEFFDNRTKNSAVNVVESEVVDIEHRQRISGNLIGDIPLAPNLCKIARPLEQPVCNPRRSPRSQGECFRALR